MHLKVYLGSGAFSHVYSATLNTAVPGEKDTVIVKVPESLAAVKSLENELNILKGLTNDGIPSLYVENLQDLRLQQRHEQSIFKCLPLKAHVGHTALDTLLLVQDRLSLEKAVVAGMKSS
jgi:hypothetical protein